MNDALPQRTLTGLHHETSAQLVAVDGQTCGQLAHLNVGVVREVALSLEAFLAAMVHGLGQHLVIQRIREQYLVLLQVEVHVLRHGELHRASVLRLHVVVNHLIAMTDNLADE